jgi:hypothetical protein
MNELLGWLPETFVRLWGMCVEYPLGALALVVSIIVAVVVSS